MSIKKIDEAIYDKEHYDSLRERGISDKRAKRVGTTPLNPKQSKKTSNLGAAGDKVDADPQLNTAKGSSTTTVKTTI